MGTPQNECSVSERTCAEEQLLTWAIDLTTEQPQYVLERVAAALTSGTGESAEREGGPVSPPDQPGWVLADYCGFWGGGFLEQLACDLRQSLGKLLG